MRYFLLLESEVPGDDPYVVAEFADRADAVALRDALAASSSLPPAVRSHEQLHNDHANTRALTAWEREDDRRLELERGLAAREVGEARAFVMRRFRVVPGFALVESTKARARQTIERAIRAVETSQQIRSELKRTIGANRWLGETSPTDPWVADDARRSHAG